MAKSSPPPVERAFTLIELLVVIVIVGIVAAIATPVFKGVLERAKATKDTNNLRQIAMAIQLYMNDNSGVLFSTTGSWMSQLYSVNAATPKYLSAWKVFLSPFDPVANPAVPNRTAATNNAKSAVSYGINATSGVVGISADRISKPAVFIVFGPAQDSTSTAVRFQGVGDTTSDTNLAASSNVKVVGTRVHPVERPQAVHTTAAQKSTRSLQTGMLRPCLGAERVQHLLIPQAQEATRTHSIAGLLSVLDLYRAGNSSWRA